MESINKELSLCLQNELFMADGEDNLLAVVEKFFEGLPPIYYKRTGCKPCWRCHGTGTNEGMT